MCNLKSGKNEPIYKPETDSQTQRTDLRLPRWRQDREGKTGRVGLAETNYSTQNGYTTRSYCVAPRHRELYPTSYDKPY